MFLEKVAIQELDVEIQEFLTTGQIIELVLDFLPYGKDGWAQPKTKE